MIPVERIPGQKDSIILMMENALGGCFVIDEGMQKNLIQNFFPEITWKRSRLEKAKLSPKILLVEPKIELAISPPQAEIWKVIEGTATV